MHVEEATREDDAGAVEGVRADAGSLPAGVHRLLAAYGERLDAIAAQPMILFRSPRPVQQRWLGRRVLLPRANFTAKILAEGHVAARVDALLRRARRFRALGGGGRNPLDLDRLDDFRSSLSPVKRSTMALWIILLTLAVAFPVAWVTDYVRAFAPKFVFGSSFSLEDITDKFTGALPQPLTPGNHVHSGASLVETLMRVAHVNLSPGSVIDTALSVRTGGPVAILLLLVVSILSLCVVLLVFRSGFRLKRTAFSAGHRARSTRHGSRSTRHQARDLYALEGEVFTAAGLRCPQEFPLDLAVSAGLLVLLPTLAGDFLISATDPQLDLATRAALTVFALGLIAVMLLRLLWLVQVWRCRIGSRVMEPQERWLPNGCSVLVRSGAYGAVLVATGYSFLAITIVVGSATGSIIRIILIAVLFSVLVLPAVAWPFGMLSWYRMHRELSSGSRCVGLPPFRFPMLALVPPLGIVFYMIAFVVDVTGFAGRTAVFLFVMGWICCPVSIYRMGRRLELLRCHAAPTTAWRARAAGIRAAATLLLTPVAVMLYFQRSLDRIWREIAAPYPPPRPGEPPGLQAAIPGDAPRSAEPAGRGEGAGTRPRRKGRRWVIWCVIAEAAITAVAVTLAVVSSVPPTVGELTSTQLRAGDCLTGSNLALDTGKPWPTFVQAVPCSGEHIAEVFYAASYWVADNTYPGPAAVGDQSDNECTREFFLYTGTVFATSAYKYVPITPAGPAWAYGDRSLDCIAYKPNARYPGGEPVKGSIRRPPR